jgi:hypothetical protein
VSGVFARDDKIAVDSPAAKHFAHLGIHSCLELLKAGGCHNLFLHGWLLSLRWNLMMLVIRIGSHKADDWAGTAGRPAERLPGHWHRVLRLVTPRLLLSPSRRQIWRLLALERYEVMLKAQSTLAL